MKCGICKFESDGNFCPHCGAPLSITALNFKKAGENKIKYNLFMELAQKTNDINTLKIIRQSLKEIK